MRQGGGKGTEPERASGVVQDDEQLGDHRLMTRTGRGAHDHRSIEDFVAVAVVGRPEEVLQIERAV